jgi:hypothetical protein
VVGFLVHWWVKKQVLSTSIPELRSIRLLYSRSPMNRTGRMEKPRHEPGLV